MSMLSIIAASRRRFNPLSLSPALWLSDAGSNAGEWDDISGNNRHATQATAANQPAIIANELNGRQVRRFDGNDILRGDFATSISQPVTVFAVAKKASNPASDNSRVFHASSSESSENNLFFPLGLNTSGNCIFNFGTSVQTTVAFGSTFIIYTTTANGSSSEIRQNGSQVATGNPGTNALARYFSIGGRHHDGLRNFIGDIAEILIFPTALSTTDRERVERYLNGKYAIY